MEWQPIENRPPEGEHLFFTPGGEYQIASYWGDNPYGRTDMAIKLYSGRFFPVTHWMPLEPPKGKRVSEEDKK